MPNRKIIVTIILCTAVISAVWIFERGDKIQKLQGNVGKETSTDQIVVTEARPDVASTLNWQKILTSVSTKTETIGSGADDTTLTARLAQDSFGRYLLAVKNGDGTPIPETDASQIAQNTLSGTNYTSIQGPQYISKNLNVVKSNPTSVQSYFDAMQKLMLTNKSNTKESVLTIVTNAVNSQKSDGLSKLDPTIVHYKNIISGLLTMPVPDDAVFVHLAFLNSLSNVLADTEAMRNSFNDPVKGLASISLYLQHLEDFLTASQNGKIYLTNKGIKI